jgi:uncharacterized protein YcfJ
MARSHHRPKKHHPQQHAVSAKAKRKGMPVFTVFGAVFGMLLGYLVGSVVGLFIGLIGGIAIGYFVGNSIDSRK